MTTQQLNTIINGLSTGALNYFFPGYSKKSLVLGHPFDDLYCSEDASDVTFSKESSGDSNIRFRRSSASKADEGVKFSIPEKKKETDIMFRRNGAVDPEPFSLADKMFFGTASELRPAEDDELSPRTRAFLREFEALQKKYDISIEEVEAAISYKVKLSRVCITSDKRIILEDFDRQEVKMDTLTKSVFLLYLKHPEGIRFKDLCDHRQELEDIYLSISGRSDLEAISRSISDLTDPMSNSINEKVSKVKRAFRDVVNDKVAKFYYIDGKAGETKKIALDRSLVI